MKIDSKQLCANCPCTFEDVAREPVGTPVDQMLPVAHDGYGAPIYSWQLNDGRSSD